MPVLNHFLGRVRVQPPVLFEIWIACGGIDASSNPIYSLTCDCIDIPHRV